MIASLPQTSVGSTPTPLPAPVLRSPAMATPSTPVLPAPVQTTTEAALPNKSVTFSRAWAAALEQVEAATAQRLKSTKSMTLPLSEPKPAPQSRTNDNAGAGIFANEKAHDTSDPLPLVLSFVAPQSTPVDSPDGTGATKAGGTKNDSSSRSAAPASADDEEKNLPSVAGDVAFTAKFKSPAPSADDQPSPASAKADAASPITDKSANVLQMVEPSPTAKPTIDAPSALPPALVANADPATIKVSSVFHAEPIEAASLTPVAAPQPMKEIAFQLPGARGVEVRLTEHAGEVRMDVRTADTGLTQDLRGNLHDLVSGLERKGISAEVTHLPDHATAPAARSADTGAFKDQGSGGGQGGAFDRQPQQRNRQPGQAPEPTTSKARITAWKEQAISTFGKENQ